MRGHIVKRGTSWSIVIELPKDVMNNKRKQKWYTVKGTKKEAEQFLTEKLRELDTGIILDSNKMLFSQYLDYWLKESCKNKLSITTYENYKLNIDTHIKKHLGNLELKKLLPLHLQSFYTYCLEKGRKDGKGGLSGKTVLYLHRIIYSALEQAVKWQLTIRNVANAVEPPKPEKYNANFLNEEETNVLLKKAKDSDIYIPILLAVFTGMRRGEVLGLTWDNIELEKGVIKVIQTLNDTKEGLKFLPPKTKNSCRNIAISNDVIKILKKHRLNQLENKLKLGNDYIENNAVCCYANGKLFNPKRFSHKFNDLLKKFKLPIVRFHDLRHSHASLLVKLGVQPKLISDRLGHSDINITMNLYSHIYEDSNKEVAIKFNSLIKAN